MLTVKKIRTFISLDITRKNILLEALFYLAWARILKSKPFSKVTPLLGMAMEETTREQRISQNSILWQVSDAINLVSEHTFWESKCLVKAIAGMKMLERRKIESTLYLGTAKDESGKLIAHAWLRSGPFIITGAEGMERFTVVGKFAKWI